MKIAVLIKQVPVVSMLKFDNETRRVEREGVPTEVNPYDVLGLSLAARLKSEVGAEVTAVTMGPPQAADALIQAIAMGADEAVHLNDRAFAGADTLATARALSAALRLDMPDLIICGRHTTDAETAQVGPEVAEMLSVPQITAASRVELSADRRSITATRLTDDGFEELECELPALVSVTDGAAEELYPSREDMERAQSVGVRTLTAADLGSDASGFGATGSPTWVDDIYAVESAREGIVVRDTAVEEAVAGMMEYLETRGAFEASDSGSGAAPRGGRLEPDGRHGAIWVAAETMRGEMRPVTLELLGRARELASELGTGVEAVLIGGEGVSGLAAELAAYGADTVHVAESASLARYDTEAYTGVLADAVRRLSPYAVLIPSTANGRDLAARLAGRLELGLTGDCVGLELTADGRLSQLKPAFGGGIVAPIFSSTLPNMATVRQGILAACALDYSVEPVIERLDVGGVAGSRVRVLRSVADESDAAAELERAERIVAVGKGIGGPESLPIIRELADALGASIGATREVADLGWLPRQHQIGLSGKAVAPVLYVAVALRGPFNHTVGIQRAGTVAAVNNSARAQIFRAADYGIVGDWREIVPALTEAVRKRGGSS